MRQYLSCMMFISIFPLFFIIRQVHTQPEITTSRRTTRAPIADAVAYNTVKGIVDARDIVGKCVGDTDDRYVVTCTVVVVSIVCNLSEVVDDGHTVTGTVVSIGTVYV